ncbi:MAG: hypothetical protein H0V86_13530 [Chloroflexia bacterium]|nr:hypothetical protein [Chloroflexia bacterium]
MSIRQRSTTYRPISSRVRLGGSAVPVAGGLQLSLFAVLLLATVGLAFRAHMYVGLSELAAIVGALLYTVRTARASNTPESRLR